MIELLHWRRTGLFDTVRPLVTYDGEGRDSRYLFGDCDWPEGFAELGTQLIYDLDYFVGIWFEYVLYQAYRDGTAHVDWHADKPFDAQAILSIGATRPVGIRREDGTDTQLISMADGDLLFMPPGAQDDWQHSVPAVAEPCGERLALVFRTVKR